MAEEPEKHLNKKGKYTIIAAFVLLVLGFVLLANVNADASNWEGAAAPILIIRGYIMIAIGILIGW